MIYALMRFPRAASCKFISVEYDSGAGFYLVNVGLMDRLTILSSGIVVDMKVNNLLVGIPILLSYRLCKICFAY